MATRTRAQDELAREQAYVDRAYEVLDAMRAASDDLARTTAAQPAGRTPAAVYERDVLMATALRAGRRLEIGDESLCFGRIDARDGDRLYVGRRGVRDETHEPLVIDWRVPAAEPFYRATGREPMGLALRRHLISTGRRLVSIEDEPFSDDPTAPALGLAGTGALVAALERPRTGAMRDIVGTIQREQDEIIRDDLAGILAVQGGPGTGKTAVALHRAAYLLFTHRAKLERQGVLIVGPNPVFLSYIEGVLPALGETGARLVTPGELYPGVSVTIEDDHEARRVKGDARMAKVIARAVSLHQRPLPQDHVVHFEGHDLRVSVGYSRRLVTIAHRSRRTHNARHHMLRSILARRLFDRFVEAERRLDPLLPATIDGGSVLGELRAHPGVQDVLREMWPSLTAERLIGDLLRTPSLLRRASERILSEGEREAILRRRGSRAWSEADLPLLDEAFVRLGPTRYRRRSEDDDDHVPTYGHVLVDEVQDLSPMMLRAVARRSRNGSMTVVGDLAQAVGPWMPRDWRAILRHLPARPGARQRTLSVNYRTPAEVMEVAARLLAEGARAPTSVRSTGEPPSFVRVAPEALARSVAERARAESAAAEGGTVVVVCAPSARAAIARALGLDDDALHLGRPISISDPDGVKGLEFDAVVIAEPARILAEHARGPNALYVAFTRATKRVVVVHAEPLPDALAHGPRTSRGK